MKRNALALIGFIAVVSGLSGQLNATGQDVYLRRAQAMEAQVSTHEGDAGFFQQLGLLYHDLSSTYGLSHGDKAVRYLDIANRLSPDPATQCYLGSAHTLAARDSLNPLAKLTELQTGLDLMDAAVKSAPENVVVRIIRASNNVALPDMFNRITVANDDLSFLLRLFQSTPGALGDYDPAILFLLKAQALIRLKRSDLALAYAQKAQSLAKDDSIRNQARRVIDTLGGGQ